MSRFGVNSHMIPDAGLSLLAAAGIDWHRIDFDWDQVEAVQGRYDWNQQDRIVSLAEKLNVSILGILTYTPAWACGSDDHAIPPRDVTDYLNFVHAATARYDGRVKAWSIWNEPNLKQFWKGTKKQFINDIWIPGLNVIRSTSPDTLTVGPDLSSARNNRDLGSWFVECLIAGKGLLDVVSHHQYDGGDTVHGRVRELERVRQLMIRHEYGNSEFWLTESGYRRVSPQHQGGLLSQTMIEMLARNWWSKTFWYDSHGEGWGLLDTESLTPRLSYFAYKDTIARFVSGEFR